MAKEAKKQDPQQQLEALFNKLGQTALRVYSAIGRITRA